MLDESWAGRCSVIFFFSFFFLFFFNYRIWIITCPNIFSLWNHGPVRHPIVPGSIRTNPLIELQSLPITRRRWMMIVMMGAPGPPWLIITNHQSIPPPLGQRRTPRRCANICLLSGRTDMPPTPAGARVHPPKIHPSSARPRHIKTKNTPHWFISFFV